MPTVFRLLCKHANEHPLKSGISETSSYLSPPHCYHQRKSPALNYGT
uniref:Uncharacterized protein n=1 Tax=Arundo donax TaxID=35708 RepID=A0A0A8XUP5_ARUDO